MIRRHAQRVDVKRESAVLQFPFSCNFAHCAATPERKRPLSREPFANLIVERVVVHHVEVLQMEALNQINAALINVTYIHSWHSRVDVKVLISEHAQLSQKKGDRSIDARWAG
jgi:hypothetical protein